MSERASVLRLILWRLPAVLGVGVAVVLVRWMLAGGTARVLRGRRVHVGAPSLDVVGAFTRTSISLLHDAGAALAAATPELVCALLLGATSLAMRTWSRSRRRYVRLEVRGYRGDRPTPQVLGFMFAGLHRLLQQRWWRRAIYGQPSLGLELHHDGETAGAAWLSVSCPAGTQDAVSAVLRGAYPNCALNPGAFNIERAPALIRLKKRSAFTLRALALERSLEREPVPRVERVLTAMGAIGGRTLVQLALVPAPMSFERLARHAFRHREAEISRRRYDGLHRRERSLLDDTELRGGLDLQHRPLFFLDLRVVAPDRRGCERICAVLRAESAENPLVERGAGVRQRLLGTYARRIVRGEGNPLPGIARSVFATSEIAALWQLPSADYATVPVRRAAMPIAPAPPGVFRPAAGKGLLRDRIGAVSIHPQMRKQNTAVPGAVEQGKSSVLVASVAEDLARERCAVIVIDPKGDAADGALSVVPAARTCTLLDFANPSAGFNPLDVSAPADVIADFVVAALKNLFTDADIRASSDRYLRNAVIAVLAADRRATLWDAARLLSVGEEGYAYRRAVAGRIRSLPAFSEISAFFTDELTAQLADARSMTTAKLDAPVNKLARLLNSPSIKRVLLNDSLRVDLDQVIARCEVLIVKGALGAMGAGNTAVLMQLLLGMLDAALARQQDLVEPAERVAVALKIDEAPLVINAGFAETMALKRSAGLETVACWQADAQWTDREVRAQLDALFAHRVYFATASARDARDAAPLAMAEFTDSVRPGMRELSALGRPDVRLRLPRHHAIASLTTPEGRLAPFLAQTIPMHVNRERIALHAARQRERGGRPLSDLRRAHWSQTDDAGRLSGPIPLQSLPGLPPRPAASFAELVEVDRAHSVRIVARAGVRVHEPDLLDREILALLGRLGHLLSTQIHNRFNPDRATTTTQRRLKRLADAALVDRLQFHRGDGGGVPMCYRLTGSGRELLGGEDAKSRTDESGPPALSQVRQELHVAAWALAVERAVGARCALDGPAGATLSPPRAQGDAALGPETLRLPDGRVPHDFLTGDGSARTEVRRFDTVRADAVIQCQGLDILVERDDRLLEGPAARKLERHDHLLAGWATLLPKYGPAGGKTLTSVFVCRSRERARELARGADGILGACRAYAGEYPFEWEYPGREGILFVSERDAHEGCLGGYGVPHLPPSVRVRGAHGDPRAGAPTPVPRALLDVKSVAAGDA